MFVHIHTKTYSARRFGSTVRRVVCENCAVEYFYELVRVGTGSSTTVYDLNKRGAQQSAAVKAERELQALLQFSHDPVP